MNGSTVKQYFVPLAGGMQAVYNSSGLQDYRHSDWLGSSRFAATTSGAVYYDGAYAPFGENYAETGTTDRSFTGQTQDTTAGLYDFLFRQQSSAQGRWLVADPAGLAAVDLTNPQTWNRYAYVANYPLNNIDPLGLFKGKCGDEERLLGCIWGGYTDAGAANMLESLSWSGQVGYNDPNNDNMFVSQDLSGLYTISVTTSSTFGKGGFSLTNPFTKLKQLVPSICSGGGFGYGGGEGEFGPAKVELIAVVAYDSKVGGEHGGIVAGGFGNLTGGIESTRTWNDWQDHTFYIGFVNGAQSITPRNLGPMQITNANYGGLVQFINGQLVVGGYGGVQTGGARALGAGAYVSLSWSGCQ
ncbi:MAG: RHS repeat-associated core domain-containing protein [Candidatus Korobacteraceae bacterium]